MKNKQLLCGHSLIPRPAPFSVPVMKMGWDLHGNEANGYGIMLCEENIACHVHGCAPLLLLAIYSIFKTESEMVEDLKMVINVHTPTQARNPVRRGSPLLAVKQP